MEREGRANESGGVRLVDNEMGSQGGRGVYFTGLDV